MMKSAAAVAAVDAPVGSLSLDELQKLLETTLRAELTAFASRLRSEHQEDLESRHPFALQSQPIPRSEEKPSCLKRKTTFAKEEDKPPALKRKTVFISGEESPTNGKREPRELFPRGAGGTTVLEVPTIEVTAPAEASAPRRSIVRALSGTAPRASFFAVATEALCGGVGLAIQPASGRKSLAWPGDASPPQQTQLGRKSFRFAPELLEDENSASSCTPVETMCAGGDKPPFGAVSSDLHARSEVPSPQPCANPVLLGRQSVPGLSIHGDGCEVVPVSTRSCFEEESSEGDSNHRRKWVRAVQTFQMRGQEIIGTSAFDCCMTGLILVDAICNGAQTDFRIRHIGGQTPLHLRVLEVMFCIIFTLELAIRMAVFGRHTFAVRGWRWNAFDTVVVGLQLLEEIVSLTSRRTGSSLAMLNGMNSMRLVRVLRLVRVFRLVRLFRFIQELRTMLCSIANSFRSLLWTIVLLMLNVYVVSVYVTETLASQGQEQHSLFEGEVLLQTRFGTLFSCALSLFQAVTGGVDWSELLVPLMQRISPLMAIVLSLYVSFTVFAVLNVVTGVFVDSALRAAKVDHDANLFSQLQELFRTIDADNSGVITWSEFAAKIGDPAMVTYFKALDIDAGEAYGLFTLLDVSDSGEINVEEFVFGCLRLRGNAQAIDLATLIYLHKRMSSRWRIHAGKVEAALVQILEALASGEDRALSRESIEFMGEKASACLGHSALDEDGPSTWAEMKAKGEARANTQRGQDGDRRPSC
eukprot:TRINITY_DN14958_c0_g1_i1.p1 TRINITY_DN14958_c0_g1~~TRINITY_DN14958_c0_g1_i1.p1  ORF type:complete len:755 (-),score=136.06 TRINITY_DN14958_c0_g1_i1:61-2325(-)